MQPFRKLFNPIATRRLMGLLLLAFLVSHGPGGALRQVLGSTHRHDNDRPAAVATAFQVVPAGLVVLAATWTARLHLDDGLLAWRDWRQDHHARSHAAGRSAPAHRHDRFERHGHDIADVSVVALDDGGAAGHRGGEGPAAAAGAGAELPLGLAGASGLAASAAAASAWPRATSPAWQNALARLPERPPRA